MFTNCVSRKCPFTRNLMPEGRESGEGNQTLHLAWYTEAYMVTADCAVQSVSLYTHYSLRGLHLPSLRTEIFSSDLPQSLHLSRGKQ